MNHKAAYFQEGSSQVAYEPVERLNVITSLCFTNFEVGDNGRVIDHQVTPFVVLIYQKGK